MLFSRHNLIGPFIPYGLGLALFSLASPLPGCYFGCSFLLLSFFLKVLISCFRLEIALGWLLKSAVSQTHVSLKQGYNICGTKGHKGGMWDPWWIFCSVMWCSQESPQLLKREASLILLTPFQLLCKPHLKNPSFLDLVGYCHCFWSRWHYYYLSLLNSVLWEDKGRSGL